MPRLAALFLITWTPLLPPAAAQPDPETPYFPAQVGTLWRYRIGDRTVTTRVAKHEQIDKVKCLRLETTDGNTVTSEYIGMQKDGAYRVRADGRDVLPPMCVCKLPPRPGTVWEVKSRFAGQTLQGKFTQSAEDISVRDKAYKAIKVTFDDARKGGDKISLTTWYAPGVGMVKQIYKTSEVDLLIELEHFEAGK